MTSAYVLRQHLTTLTFHHNSHYMSVSLQAWKRSVSQIFLPQDFLDGLLAGPLLGNYSVFVFSSVQRFSFLILGARLSYSYPPAFVGTLICRTVTYS